jgi:hypothetical protein
MKKGFTVILALSIMLTVSAMVNSQTMPMDYIYSVIIYVDGLSQGLSTKALESNLMTEDGVDKVIVNPQTGTVIVKIKDGKQVSLFNLMNRVNETREKSDQFIFRKMKVDAIAHVVKLPITYISTAKESNARDRYMLQIGNTNIILAENNMLDNLVKSGYEQVIVSGVVTAFSDAMPIMVIGGFKKIGSETALKPEVMPKESISSVKIYVDGLENSSLSHDALKANIMTEEGVSKITIDSKNGYIMITPKSDGKQLSLYNLSKRVNETRQKDTKFNVILIKVEAVGHLVSPIGEAGGETDEQESRIQEHHKLQIGDIFFYLTENDNLKEMVNNGLNEVDINGTVVRFTNTIPEIEVDSFDTAIGESLLDIGPDPLDKMSEGFEKEKEIMKASKHSHIDSVRFYMDSAISSDFADSVKKDLLQIPGVEAINVDPKINLVEFMPKYGEPFDIYNIWHHIDMLKGYKVIKADVVATGEVIEADGGYQASIARPQLYKHYRLATGDFMGFILAPNNTLSEVLNLKINPVTVIGTIVNFMGRTPILEIKEYQKLEVRPDWLK